MEKHRLENSATESTMLKINKKFDKNNGNALVCAYENLNLLSKTSMKHKKVLEFGCGSLPASFGIPDNQMPKTYIATDVSKKLINAAKKIDGRPKYMIQSAYSPKLPKNSFDLIIMRGVLHYLQNPSEALMKIARLLKRNGDLLIYEPNLSSQIGNAVKWILLKLFKINMEVSPYGQLTQSAIKKAINDANLKLDKKWYGSLLAFPLSGDYGRYQVLPNNRNLYQIIIALDKAASSFLNRFPILASSTHLRVIFLAQKGYR